MKLCFRPVLKLQQCVIRFNNNLINTNNTILKMVTNKFNVKYPRAELYI